MAITVKYLTELGIEEETARKIFAERGKEIEDSNKKYADLETQFASKQADLDNIAKELSVLKENNATAEEWKNKYEAFAAEVKQKEEQAQAERAAKEKADGISNRFVAVVGERKFMHEAIKTDYLKKFGEAIESKDYLGKSDADIFNELTKDDATAFENVSRLDLPGGATGSIGTEIDEAAARAVMGLPPIK